MAHPRGSRVSHTVSHTFRLCAALACMLVAAQASAGNEIHRCTDGGSVTYTDRGCGASAEAAVLTVASLGTPRDSQAAVDREVPVTLGMSPRSVFETLGRPVETIATLQGRQLIEYWIYHRATAGITRVAFQEGRVTGIHAR